MITGASSGMGAETAILCSQLGASVILVARREEKLIEVKEKLEGNGHIIFPFDLSKVDEIEGLVKSIITESGALDGFVHSAGISSTRPLKMLKPSHLSEVMNINFNSFVEITRCITKKNCFNDGLSIVGVSSISSTLGNQTKTAYCASKAAMDAVVRCFAKEFAKDGVRANTVCPGMINTDIYEKFKDNAGDSYDAEVRMYRQYLGLGEPADVAEVIAFLLSNASRFITGSNIGVDGGMLSS
ncbi:SDR family NAD(P)-dependent oxidoreductase [Pseudobutyrivibrio xylanivorans]|nr:SDR family oxidoreductase [Pseudobutyrivibrio xylanivorans]